MQLISRHIVFSAFIPALRQQLLNISRISFLHFQVRNSKTIYFENGDTKEDQICRDAPTANGSHPSEWPHFYGRPFMRQAVLLYWYEQVARQYDMLCCSLPCQTCYFWLSTVHEAAAARSSAHPAWARLNAYIQRIFRKTDGSNLITLLSGCHWLTTTVTR